MTWKVEATSGPRSHRKARDGATRIGAALAMVFLISACLTACTGGDVSRVTSNASARGSTLAVTVARGEVVDGEGRAEVELGSMVKIVVLSDVADEVHVHGYDISMPVRPGVERVLTFKATIPGVFEVEMERLGTQLLSVQVA